MLKVAIAVVVLMLTILPFASVHASQTGRLNQLINAGVLSTDVVDGSSVTVGSPSFSMTATSVATSCQTITGTYGSSTQRVAVDNPDGADAGWTLTMAATGGVGATWTNGTNTYDYNDTAGSGCTAGQLTLNPAVAPLNLNGSSTSTGVTKGTSTAFVSGSVNSITLMTAAAGSDDIWNGYLTGIGVSQKIPAGTPAGSYYLDLTQTVTAS